MPPLSQTSSLEEVSGIHWCMRIHCYDRYREILTKMRRLFSRVVIRCGARNQTLKLKNKACGGK